jgi:hypothetical protein
MPSCPVSPHERETVSPKDPSSCLQSSTPSRRRLALALTVIPKSRHNPRSPHHPDHATTPNRRTVQITTYQPDRTIPRSRHKPRSPQRPNRIPPRLHHPNRPTAQITTYRPSNHLRRQPITQRRTVDHTSTPSEPHQPKHRFLLCVN